MSRSTPVRPPGKAVLAAFVSVVALFAALAACGPSEEERVSAARADAWAELEEDQAALKAKREELSALRARAAAPAEGEDAEALAAEVEALDGQAGDDADAFNQKLVNYINEAEWELGGEMTPEQRDAFGMMSAEAMYTAEEYVVKGGDYRRAVDIIERAMANDPENPALQERLAQYQADRYVGAERLDQVKNGMTEAEVEGILGKVYNHNQRSFPDGRFAWFYPKDPEEHGDGAAAGVYFNQAREVFRKQWEAVEGRKEEDGDA